VIASFLLVGDCPYAARMVACLKGVNDCPVVQMSDLHTPKVAGVDEVIRLPFRIPLMPYRLKHLANFPHTELLVIDTDVIAKAPIGNVWAKPFDVALTVRDYPLHNGVGAELDMPFNTGVMFSRSQAFWQESYEWLMTQSAERQRWYGDQLAVAEVAKRGTYNVLSLSCDEYNWSPNSRSDTSNAKFWHYKGAVRKKWIYEHRDSPDICRV
jgi:hypothetical protein